MHIDFRTNSYNFAMNIIPIDRNNSGIPIVEMLRVIVPTGFGILGAPASVWEGENLFEEIKALDADGQLTFLSLQKIKCIVSEENKDEMEYSLTVFRKGDQVRVKLV